MVRPLLLFLREPQTWCEMLESIEGSESTSSTTTPVGRVFGIEEAQDFAPQAMFVSWRGFGEVSLLVDVITSSGLVMLL